MQDVSAAVSAYLKQDIYRVHGWLKRLDATFIASLAAWQVKHQVRGALVEIGVHHGKLFLILALSRQAGEKALAIDLFEDDAGNTGRASGRHDALRRHANRLKVTLGQDEVLQSNSLKLAPEDILGRVGPARLFSVDGGHLYKHVTNDLALADATVLDDQGIVIVDDFCNPDYPEVTFGTYDYLLEHPKCFAPAAMTRNKLYLARPSSQAAVATHANAFASVHFGSMLTNIAMVGYTLPQLRVGMKDRVLDEVRSRLPRW